MPITVKGYIVMGNQELTGEQFCASVHGVPTAEGANSKLVFAHVQSDPLDHTILVAWVVCACLTSVNARQ